MQKNRNGFEAQKASYAPSFTRMVNRAMVMIPANGNRKMPMTKFTQRVGTMSGPLAGRFSRDPLLEDSSGYKEGFELERACSKPSLEDEFTGLLARPASLCLEREFIFRTEKQRASEKLSAETY